MTHGAELTAPTAPGLRARLTTGLSYVAAAILGLAVNTFFF